MDLPAALTCQQSANSEGLGAVMSITRNMVSAGTALRELDLVEPKLDCPLKLATMFTAARIGLSDRFRKGAASLPTHPSVHRLVCCHSTSRLPVSPPVYRL